MKLGDELKRLHPESNDRYRWSDIGNGNLFADVFKSCARYVPEKKSWFIFGGKRWEQDVSGVQANELCKQLADALSHYAIDLRDPVMKDSYLKFVGRWQKKQIRNTILSDALSVHTKSFGEFDSAPWILNVQNGSLDLRTEELYPHNPEDFLTMLAGTSYNPSAKCPRWLEFIGEVTCDDVELARFIQKAFGYALAGDTSEETCFILYGPSSRNGKSVLLETFQTLMGDYGCAANPDSLAARRFANGGAPSEDIARLAGRRFVALPEPDEGMILSSSRLKSFTGGDTITARMLHESSFDFKPQFKLFFGANYLPHCTDSAIFASGRINVVPFNRHFSPGEQDKGLKRLFTNSKNLSAVLNWALEGFKMYCEEGLNPPEAVRIATEAYAQQEAARPTQTTSVAIAADTIAQFISEAFEQEPFAEVRSSDAYRAYQGWCASNGYPASSLTAFGRGVKGYLPVTRKKPIAGGEKSSVIVDYKLRKLPN